MEQVGDALAAPRVASVAGEKSMWWSPEKGVRTKKAGQSGEECETASRDVIPHYGSAPDHTRPEGVDRVGITSRPVELRCTGSARLARNTKRSEKTDHFHVTSEARASCELAS